MMSTKHPYKVAN